METSNTKTRFWIQGTSLMASLTALALLYFFSPTQYRFYPPCLFHSLTGLDCPGCGALRATHQLLHGNFKAALVLNPLFVALLPVAGFFWIYPAQRRKLNENKIWLWTVMPGLILFTVLRNFHRVF
jgi:hypothetical protein